MIKSTLVRKKIGDKTYNIKQHKEIEYFEKLIPLVPEFLKKVVTESSYKTNGEDLILIKNAEHCNLVLDNSKSDHLIIKVLTNVTITPSIGKIDEYYDELNISKGACVEMVLIENNWYIISSDGIKLD
jgi:hypothetical protein